MSSHDPAPHKTNGQPNYETTDAHVPAILKSGVSVYVTMGVAFVAMLAMYYGLEKMPVRFDREPNPQLMERNLPPGPPLLVDELGNLKNFRANEELILNSYHRDARSGAIRIPIADAMKALVHRAESKAGSAKAGETKKAAH